MPVKIPYKSFCWSLGTTSFRTKNFNKTIEEQLALLDEFWSLPENASVCWIGNNTLQEHYYDFMKEKGFVEGEANNKPKDAREKTSGLVDIGLIDDNRKLTEAGLALLQISEANDFASDNLLQIPKDSFIYLKQLLKTSNDVSGNCVRPFIVILYVLSKLEYLTFDEFTYLLPLCTDIETTHFIIRQILLLRTGRISSIDEVIINRLMAMENYQTALSYFEETSVSKDVIRIIGMNRKSSKEDGKNYDKAYFPMYNALYNLYVLHDETSIVSVYEATRDINIGKWWRALLFDTSSSKAIHKEPRIHLKHTEFDNVSDENDFKSLFFKMMHLFKAKATLSDYLDLNRRYIKTTDIILFEDNVVKLDIVPKQIFNGIIDELWQSAFEPSELLFDDCRLDEIAECLRINETTIINGINNELGTSITTITEAYNVVEENRYRRLQHLIDTKFTDDKILTLLDLFESRSDTEIRSMVTDNADVPTIFEYILGILWYKASDRKGKILDYMKLSLDADLLPKTHAAGGEADIVYEYERTEYYPEHTLLLEATLADGTNQRRMEMEPVSRHLGQHLIRTGNMNSYCVFATNFLNINVISDFRARKTTPYYDSTNYEKYVDGMKIIPLETNELKSIVSKGVTYKELYAIFEDAYTSELRPHEWYDECIRII